MPKPGLPKKYAKLGFKKGWRAFKAAKRKRRGTRKGQRRKTARRAFTKRRSHNPRGRKMARKSKNVNVNLVELGGGLVLADQILGAKGMANLFAGDFRGAISTAASRFRAKSTQEDLIKTGLGIVVIKAAAKSLGQRRLGKIGPLVLRA